MRLTTFEHNGIIRIGVVIDNEIVDTTTLENTPDTMTGFLAAKLLESDILQELIVSNRGRIPLNEVKLKAPVTRPPKFFGVGLNYLDHIEETGKERPEYPTFFNKQSTCVIGPGEAIQRPKVSAKLDYEGEFGFVIGKRCRHVPQQRAHEVIAGYLIVNDVSVRDWQVRTHTWTLGKSFDTHGPTGPWIVTADEIGDPHNLDIKTWVNDELRQSSNTRHLLFNCFYLVEYLSTVCTLEPGDIISTGTSSGVGVKMSPRGYIKPGDMVTIEIEKIGKLSNPVIEEPDDSAFID